MTTTKIYREIKDTHVDCYAHKCFFAFNNEQLKEGEKKAGVIGEKLYSAGGGLIGTKEGIESYFKAIDKINDRISKECDPQDVYDYEFLNHECSYMHDDLEAIKLVAAYFGEEKARTIKRRCAFVDIDLLFAKNG